MGLVQRVMNLRKKDEEELPPKEEPAPSERGLRGWGLPVCLVCTLAFGPALQLSRCVSALLLVRASACLSVHPVVPLVLSYPSYLCDCVCPIVLLSVRPPIRLSSCLPVQLRGWRRFPPAHVDAGSRGVPWQC